MSNLADKAVSGDKQSFADFRKLTACGLSLIGGLPVGEAAVQSDKSIFQKVTEYAVGKGEMMADQAVDAMIDRGAAHLTTIIHRTISTAVSAGCRVAGGWIGHFFGPQGAVVGQQIGAKVAAVLNTGISTLVSKGVSKVKEVAKNVIHKGAELLKTGIRKVGNWLKSWF